MTTTANGKTRAKPPKKNGKTRAKPPKNDLTHGPVAAAFNASVWPLCLAAIGKATGGIPPWAPLVVAVVLAGCLVAAGMHRHPRPLSRISLIYRAAVVLTAGGWLWWQLATFTALPLTVGQIAGLVVAWPALLVTAVLVAGARRLNLMFRMLLPGVPLTVAAVLTVMQLGPITVWLHGVLLVTDRFDPGMAPVRWIGYAVISLAFVAAPIAVLGVTFANREQTADEELAALQRRDNPGSPGGQGRAFLKLICKLTNEYTEWKPENPYESGRRIANLKITETRLWKNGAGEEYIIDLTGNEKGTTRTRLRSFTDDIATKMNLPHGCGVEILPAKDSSGEPMGAGFASVQISRVNVLKLTIDYPALQARSILNPLPVGRTRSDKEIGPLLRELSAYVWGQKGSGKTGTIYDIIAGAMQCTDCLVWVIDLNRGNAARPFLRAWSEGRVNRPCIDWVATTVDEVARMAQVGLDIALDRKNFYADLKFDANTNLMPVGNGRPGQPPPEILIVIDEGATVLGAGGSRTTDEGRAAAELLGKIMDLARDAAVNIVFSGLRVTSDVADTAFLRGTGVRIGMRVTDDAELGHGFGDYKLSGKQVPYRGSGYIRCGYSDDDDEAGDDIMVFKAYYLDPKRMDAVGEECTQWRPFLDDRSLQTAGTKYANRWQRTAHLLWDNPRPEILAYGTRPGHDDGNTIDGDIVVPEQRSAPTTAAEPTDDLAIRGLLRPTGDTFEDMIEQGKKMDDALRRREQGAEAGPPAPSEPPQPVAPQPAGPPAADNPADLTDATVEQRFGNLVDNFTVLDEDPETAWYRSGKITPDEELAAAPADTRIILERLIRFAGPITAGQMHEMLLKGGDWGPPVKISKVAMHRALKEPKSKGAGPVEWLAPRATGDPYNHRKNVSG